MLNLKKYEAGIKRVCRKHSVRRLWIFGSALTKNFKRTSDVDLVVDYDRSKVKNLADAYFDFADDCEKLFGRPVDLLTNSPIRNPYFREELEKTRQLIYEQSN